MNDKKIELVTQSMSAEEFESKQIEVLKTLEGLTVSSAIHLLNRLIERVSFNSRVTLVFSDGNEDHKIRPSTTLSVISVNELKVKILGIASKHVQYEGDTVSDLIKVYNQLIKLIDLD